MFARVLCRIALFLLPMFSPQVAQAHAILMDSQPALHGSVPAGPLDIVLHFNSRVDRARSRLVLRGPPADQVLALATGGPADQLSARITLPPGDYTLRWQVLAIDGHLTRGDVPFSVGPRDGVYSDKRP